MLPRDYNIPILQEFPRDSLTYVCTDNDVTQAHPDGINPTQEGEGRVTVKYINNDLDVIDVEGDYCVQENIDENTTCNVDSVSEVYCGRNELGQPAVIRQTIPCAQGMNCISGACRQVEHVQCDDSDGGDNREIWGHTTVEMDDRGYQDYDYCYGSGRCTEQLCINNRDCARKYYIPPQDNVINNNPHLMDGVRIQLHLPADTPIPQYGACIDYDFGDHETIGSYVQALDPDQHIVVTHSDQCIDDHTLREMVCQDNRLNEQIHQCANGCVHDINGDYCSEVAQ